MGTRVLSFHADYGCRHRGRCCSSHWPIAVDASQRDQIERAMAGRVLATRRPGGAAAPSPFADRDPAGPALLANIDGRCVFHDDHAGGGCRIHRALGHAALPLACRQFPRQSVHDPRGVSVTLSHYCPTAQDLLTGADGPVTVVTNASAFPETGEYVGLTANPALPPLLHPRLAMDWESWWLFEELSVALLCETTHPLTRLGIAVEHARLWEVGRGSLADHLRRAFVRAHESVVAASMIRDSTIRERVEVALSAVPDEWRAAASNAVSASRVEHDPGVRARFLAAHAFANWAAYEGEGLRTWFRSIETAACVLSRAAEPGDADLILRHLADGTALIDEWNSAEQEAIACAR